MISEIKESISKVKKTKVAVDHERGLALAKQLAPVNVVSSSSECDNCMLKNEQITILKGQISNLKRENDFLKKHNSK